MSNRRNYYRILHVQPDAPEAVIRSSYRAIMQKLKRHPDLGGDHTEAALLNEALEVLTNAKKRAAYDRQLAQSHAQADLTGERRRKAKPKAAAQGARPAGRSARSPRPGPQKPPKPKPRTSCAFCDTPHGHLRPGEQELTCTGCDSPLSLARPLELEQSCRRSVKRVAVNDEPVHYYTAWPQRHKSGRLQDISPNGMAFITGEPMHKAQVIKLSSGLVHAIAEVMSCKTIVGAGTKAYAIGVRFLTLRFQRTKGTFVFERA